MCETGERTDAVKKKTYSLMERVLDMRTLGSTDSSDGKSVREGEYKRSSAKNKEQKWRGREADLDFVKNSLNDTRATVFTRAQVVSVLIVKKCAL